MPNAPTGNAADPHVLVQYSAWANDRMLSTLQAADDVPGKTVELMSHLLRAQDIWYGRVQKSDHADVALWADDDLAACVERAEASIRRWQKLLEDRSAEALDQSIAYTNSKGTAYETSLRDIVRHVVNHGTHHRAQIALLLRQAEVAPPPTDYIFFLREL